MVSVKIEEWEMLDCKDAVIIDGFPSVGAVSTIVASYIIDALGLKQVGVVESELVPPVAIIKEGQPLSPIRIYASPTQNGEDPQATERNVVVFISEFPLLAEMVRPMSEAMIKWGLSRGCSLLISPEGVGDQNGTPENGERDIEAFGVASTSRARELMKETDCKGFRYGTITGVTGVLLGLGRQHSFDVIAMLAESREDMPDARAAAKLIECINPLLSKVNIVPGPLLEEASRIENSIPKVMTMGQVVEEDEVPLYG